MTSIHVPIILQVSGKIVGSSVPHTRFFSETSANASTVQTDLCYPNRSNT
jgi:hypothetical protein